MAYNSEVLRKRTRCNFPDIVRRSNDVYYGKKLATTAEPLILWYQLRNMGNFKLRVLSNEFCLDFIGQIIDEISHYSSLRHCLWPSKWRVRRSAKAKFIITNLSIWTAFRCWIQIVHPFDRSATNKRATAWFHVDSTVAKVGRIDSV